MTVRVRPATGSQAVPGVVWQVELASVQGSEDLDAFSGMVSAARGFSACDMLKQKKPSEDYMLHFHPHPGQVVK